MPTYFIYTTTSGTSLNAEEKAINPMGKLETKDHNVMEQPIRLEQMTRHSQKKQGDQCKSLCPASSITI